MKKIAMMMTVMIALFLSGCRNDDITKEEAQKVITEIYQDLCNGKVEEAKKYFTKRAQIVSEPEFFYTPGTCRNFGGLKEVKVTRIGEVGSYGGHDIYSVHFIVKYKNDPDPKPLEKFYNMVKTDKGLRIILDIADIKYLFPE
jgi:hypothetical protein